MINAPLRLLIDGIGSAPIAGAANPWLALARWLDACDELAIFWLDRGGPAPEGAKIRFVPFPAHRQGACAADSLLIQQVCDHFRIAVFASTGWTTPVATPALLLVDEHTMNDAAVAEPPRLGQERALALCFARQLLCSSPDVSDRLAIRHPLLPLQRRAVASQDWSCRTGHQLLPELGAQLVHLCESLSVAAAAGRYASFFATWSRLRMLQSTVDI